MAFKKMTKQLYPSRLWALVGNPGSGKSTFATQMTGPILVVDADHRFDEVLDLAPGAVYELSNSPADNVDADRINQDATWPEIIAMTERADDPERPQLKQARDGTSFVQFKVKLDSSAENENYAQELKAAAVKASQRERKEMRSAKRQHKKIPHYVV